MVKGIKVMEEEVIKEKTKKQKNGYKIATILLSIWVCFLLTYILIDTLNQQKLKIIYNGVQYEDNYAYINLILENNSGDQVIFDENNFSIRNTGNTKTSSTVYFERNSSYIQLTSTYILNSDNKVKLKVQFNKKEITNTTILYFNGEKIAEL